MDAKPLTGIEHASAGTVPGWRRWCIGLVAVLGLYVGAYVVLRAFVEPAANMAYFVYCGSGVVDEGCYYAFWPLYRADRFLTGRTHNLDRTYESPVGEGP